MACHCSVTTVSPLKGFAVYNGVTVCVWLALLVEFMPIDRVVPGLNPATDSNNSVYESSKTISHCYSNLFLDPVLSLLAAIFSFVFYSGMK